MVWDKQHQVGVTESRGLLAERVRIKDKKQTTKQKPQIPPPPQTKQNNQEKNPTNTKTKGIIQANSWSNGVVFSFAFWQLHLLFMTQSFGCTLKANGFHCLFKLDNCTSSEVFSG